MKIGIMGGTFDPIHLGHLATAEAVRESFSLDEILFIPAARPPHKLGKLVTDEKHRLAMTILATRSNKFFKVSDMELKRTGLSYTLDTINELHKIFGSSTELFFIIGADSLADLFKWHAAKELVAKCHFIATTRQGVDVDFSAVEKFFGAAAREHIHRVTTPGLEISSTDLREKIRLGRSIKYLVPEAVEEYILKEKLYDD
ncbi:MAG: nicotinate-nucleotide adenylyltransferase [Quinella sp. 3Q1]|nr:nicotinate-nucleotide adenylyltransferase [Quinella sp. 3Q1]MBR3051546.1 nicotinate-nucleotide adenylyltransferase [Selenomonadaceae bacterium]MBR6888372.1 nicotinate-nucleotide adenylyltransferase [Selenomonadaceae bacterium]